MATARKSQVSTKTKRTTKHPPAQPEFDPPRVRIPPSKEVLEERRRWLDEYVPIKPKRPIEGEELEEAIRTTVIVVDTNIIAYSMIAGRQTAAAKRALRKEDDWIVPPRWRSEFRSVLHKHIRAGTLDFDGALRTFTLAVMKFGSAEQQPETRRVLSLAENYDIDVYDAEFVALADEWNIPLLTADEASLASRVPDRLVLRLSTFSD